MNNDDRYTPEQRARLRELEALRGPARLFAAKLLRGRALYGADADDVCNAVMARVSRRLLEQPLDNLKAYVLQAVLNEIRGLAGRGKQAREVPADGDPGTPAQPGRSSIEVVDGDFDELTRSVAAGAGGGEPAPEPLDELIADEERAALQAQLATLCCVCRHACRLFEEDDRRSAQEVWRSMGDLFVPPAPENTVRDRVKQCVRWRAAPEPQQRPSWIKSCADWCAEHPPGPGLTGQASAAAEGGE